MFLFASISQRLLITHVYFYLWHFNMPRVFSSSAVPALKRQPLSSSADESRANVFVYECFLFPQLNSSAVVFWSAPRPWPVLLWKLLLCCWLAWRQMWIPVWHQPVGEQAEVHVSRWQNLQQQRSVCSGQDTDPAQDPIWALISF